MNKSKNIKLYGANTFWFLLTSITTKLANFLVMASLAASTNPELLGVLANFEAFARVLTLVMGLYLESAFLRYYNQFQKSGVGTHKVFISTHLWFSFCWSIFVAFLFYLVLKTYGYEEYNAYHLLIILIIITELLNQSVILFSTALKAELHIKRLTLVQLTCSLSAFLITIFMITFHNAGIESRLIGLFVLTASQSAYLLRYFSKQGLLSFKYDHKILTQSLKFSLPMLPLLCSGWILQFSDRILLSHFGLLDSVGIYSIAMQIGMIMYLAVDGLTQVQNATAFKNLELHPKQADEDISSFIQTFIILFIAAYLFFLVVSNDIVNLFFDNRYAEASSISIILGATFFFGGVYRALSPIIAHNNKTFLFTLFGFLQMALNFTLNYIFIPKFGVYAASISTLISSFFYTFLIFLAARKLSVLKFNVKILLSVTFWGASVFALLFSIRLIYEYSFLTSLLSYCICVVFLLVILKKSLKVNLAHLTRMNLKR